MYYKAEAIKQCNSFKEIADNQDKIDMSKRQLRYKPTFKKIWEVHEELFLKIEEIASSDVYFVIFDSILYVEWCEIIKEAIKPKRYDVFFKEIDDAITTAQGFSPYTIEFNFPNESSTTLKKLEIELKKCHTLDETRRIMLLIKNVFGKKTLRYSKHHKITEKNNKIFEMIRKKL